jgi:alpha-tubulin suppressor-like RCC1 family protein
MNGQVIFLAAGPATITARTAFRTASITITAFERRFLVMDAADDYTCGLTALGRGWCWGNADGGRTAAGADSTCFDVNNETAGCILPPKRMNRPDLVFTSISTGRTFACGIVTEQVYCWGDDGSGQIGNGLDGAGATPSLATVKTHRFTTVTAGATHACALNLVGTAYCWGNDGFDKLGDPPSINSTTPIPIADTTLSFRAITAGDNHTCALTTAGAAYCWGDNSSGQIGSGLAQSSPRPVLVAGGLVFTAISAGAAHTCAIDTAANLYCWGDNSGGQLGLGITSAPQFVPVLVSGGGGYTAVSSGEHHTCGIAVGTVRCWGTSTKGEIGNGVTTFPNTVLAPASIGLTATSITAGRQHSCAITTTGVAMCWGTNEYGVLGNEYQAAFRATPQVVARPR